jgi:hypothetical protein
MGEGAPVAEIINYQDGVDCFAPSDGIGNPLLWKLGTKHQTLGTEH